MLITARWVVPVSSPPIENGAVLIENDRIVSVGLNQSQRRVEGIDLGDSVLFPGLVNAHCHLEFSGLKGEIEAGLSFTEWIKNVVGLRTQLIAPLRDAIDSLLRGGTTTVADHCNPNTPPIETPFRRIIFWEVLGAHPERAYESFRKARERAEKEGGFVTPHSLYAVHEEVLEEIFSGRQMGLPLQSIHILESSDEEQFFRKQTGPLAVYVQERGGDLSFPVSSPIKWLAANHWLGSRTLVVHGNYLNSEEIELLQRQGAGVIHAPGSHRFFGHKPFPLAELKKRGIRIALGTDSLASNEDLSMLREMRLLREFVGKEEVLQMATIEGARLLKRDHDIGSIEPGKKADLVAVPFQSDPYESVFQAEEVSFSMIDGKRYV
jgi:cytosine/adenosine deaminase-related metal-dependent hydrolase